MDSSQLLYTYDELEVETDVFPKVLSEHWPKATQGTDPTTQTRQSKARSEFIRTTKFISATV
jgi:hypothetical protein